MRVYEHSYMAGRLGPAGLNLFAATEGVFGSTHTKNGVAMIRLAGLEAPEQIGRVERRGAMLKKMMSKVIKDTHSLRRESMICFSANV